MALTSCRAAAILIAYLEIIISNKAIILKTLQKALDLLELVSTRDGEAVTPKTASEKLGINQSSCVRLMQTLTDRGYLTQVSRRAGYTGGPALTAYGCRKTCCNTLVAAAGEQLRRLSTELGGRMINLSVAHRDRRYLIFQCGHTPGARVGDFIGHTWDLEENATELLLLAASPETERLRILQQAKVPGRYTSRAEFLRELDRLHRQRHVIFYGERQSMWIVGGLMEPPGFPAATLGFGMMSRNEAEESLPAVHRCMNAILHRLAPPVPFNC